MVHRREMPIGSTHRQPEIEPRINRPTPLPLRQHKRTDLQRPGRHRRRQLLCVPVRFGVVYHLSLEKTTDPEPGYDGR